MLPPNVFFFFFDFPAFSFSFTLITRFLLHLVAQGAPLTAIARVFGPLHGKVDAAGGIAHANNQDDGDGDFLHKRKVGASVFLECPHIIIYSQYQ